MDDAIEGLQVERSRDLLDSAEHEPGTVGHRVAMSRREVIDDCDLVPGPEEPGCDNASDIAGTTRDENVHLGSPKDPEPARRAHGTLYTYDTARHKEVPVRVPASRGY